MNKPHARVLRFHFLITFILLVILVTVIVAVEVLRRIAQLRFAQLALARKQIVLQQLRLPRLAAALQIAFVQIRNANLLARPDGPIGRHHHRVVRMRERDRCTGIAIVIELALHRVQGGTFGVEEVQTDRCAKETDD